MFYNVLENIFFIYQFMWPLPNRVRLKLVIIQRVLSGCSLMAWRMRCVWDQLK